MKITKVIPIMLTVCCLASCGSTQLDENIGVDKNAMMNSSAYEGAVSYSSEASVTDSVGVAGSGYTYIPNSSIMDTNKKFIRRVRVNVAIEDSEMLQDTITYMSTLAGTYDGYVSYSSAELDGGHDYGTVIINVPKDKVDELLLEVQQNDSFSVTGVEDAFDDVTTQYTDTESRLHMKEVARDKYMAMLEEATSMEDIINIQRELNIILEDLEAQQSQMNRLDNKVEFTEITININSKHNVTKVKFSDRLIDGMMNIIENLADPLIAGLSVLIGGAIFIMLSAPVIYLAIRLVIFSIHTKISIKRHKKNMDDKE